ncbi:MAG: RND family efflux transporter MFP subunit [Bacteroidia bacterium]|jgi:RND family efflux transporter MFP subunit
MTHTNFRNSLLILFFTLIVGCSTDKNEEDTIIDQSVPVVVTQVRNLEYSDEIKTSGQISFNNEYKMSFKTGGIIQSVLVREGQRVQAGKLLATIKPDEIEAKTSQAEISVDKARRDYQRTEALYKDSVATLEQLQNAESQWKNAEENLNAARFNQNQSSIIAPTNGVVQKILMNPNEITGAGNPIIIFGAEDQGKVLVTNVSDIEVVEIKLGDNASLHFDAWPEAIFKGKILEIAGMANPKTGTFEVKIQVNDANNQLKSGFMGSATILSSIVNNWVEIPIECLLQANKKNGVVYKVENETAVKQEVKIAKILNDKLLISSGLSENDQTIIEGLEKLKGDSISIKIAY